MTIARGYVALLVPLVLIVRTPVPPSPRTAAAADVEQKEVARWWRMDRLQQLSVTSGPGSNWLAAGDCSSCMPDHARLRTITALDVLKDVLVTRPHRRQLRLTNVPTDHARSVTAWSTYGVAKKSPIKWLINIFEATGQSNRTAKWQSSSKLIK